MRAVTIPGLDKGSTAAKRLAEEAPDAYKDVDRVAEVSHQLGIGTKVLRMTPIGVAKG